jgi:hypothetical protein
MGRHHKATGRIPVRLLVALSEEVTAVPASRRDRPVPRIRPEPWSQMSRLERVLAADREDPDFDYAAN